MRGRRLYVPDFHPLGTGIRPQTMHADAVPYANCVRLLAICTLYFDFLCRFFTREESSKTGKSSAGHERSSLRWARCLLSSYFLSTLKAHVFLGKVPLLLLANWTKSTAAGMFLLCSASLSNLTYSSPTTE